jgi:hypothetical protein
MRIAHVALWTHDLDGRRNSNSERFRCFDRRGYPAKALGFRQRCSDQAFPVALVPPLSRPFPTFTAANVMSGLRRNRTKRAHPPRLGGLPALPTSRRFRRTQLPCLSPLHIAA